MILEAGLLLRLEEVKLRFATELQDDASHIIGGNNAEFHGRQIAIKANVGPVTCPKVEVRCADLFHGLDQHIDVEIGFYEGIGRQRPGNRTEAMSDESLDDAVDGGQSRRLGQLKGRYRNVALTLFQINVTLYARLFHLGLDIFEGGALFYLKLYLQVINPLRHVGRLHGHDGDVGLELERGGHAHFTNQRLEADFKYVKDCTVRFTSNEHRGPFNRPAFARGYLSGWEKKSSMGSVKQSKRGTV